MQACAGGRGAPPRRAQPCASRFEARLRRAHPCARRCGASRCAVRSFSGRSRGPRGHRRARLRPAADPGGAGVRRAQYARAAQEPPTPRRLPRPRAPHPRARLSSSACVRTGCCSSTSPRIARSVPLADAPPPSTRRNEPRSGSVRSADPPTALREQRDRKGARGARGLGIGEMRWFQRRSFGLGGARLPLFPLRPLRPCGPLFLRGSTCFGQNQPFVLATLRDRRRTPSSQKSSTRSRVPAPLTGAGAALNAMHPRASPRRADRGGPCVVRSFYGLSFPAPEEGIVRVTYRSCSAAAADRPARCGDALMARWCSSSSCPPCHNTCPRSSRRRPHTGSWGRPASSSCP